MMAKTLLDLDEALLAEAVPQLRQQRVSG